MTNDLLDIDARLLILRYGRTKVLQALARIGDQTIDELEQQMQVIARKPRPPRAKPSVVDLFAAHAKEHPAIADPLRTLAVGFENRTFLPHLRDVQRFLDRTGVAHGKLKSRAAAAPAVVRALAKLAPDNIARLAATDQGGNDSDYSLLAHAIMGTSAPSPPDESEKK